MPAALLTDRPAEERPPALARSLGAHAWAIPGLLVVALMLVWAVHDGGYDADTWYWGALVMLALLAAVVIARGPQAIRLSRASVVALVAFALYVGWSYLSISWARSPGDALDGSNRALLYLLVFATMLVLPWTARGALVALLAFAIGVGVTGVVLLVRLASADHVEALLIGHRLAAPTGYYNATAALFTIQALVSVGLAARRELPGLLRGALIGFACVGLQLAVIDQSRGWLFTLPLFLIAAIVLLPDRLRVAAAALLPTLATLAIVHRLLHVYEASGGAAVNHAASRAGHSALLVCALTFFIATLIAWGESLLPRRRPSALRRRLLGAVAIALALGGAIVGGLTLSHGDPFGFVSRQWNGFSHEPRAQSGSHFTDVGSGRYDFWRVSLDAVAAHPIGGLGQDNFDNYYVTRRRTNEEPSYTHSLEFRLLTHTGLVGTALFVSFMIAAVAAGLRGRRQNRRGAARAGPATRPRTQLGVTRSDPGARAQTQFEAAPRDPRAVPREPPAVALAAIALLPFVVWLVYGSVDWFWEFPALSGPALGFMGMAAAIATRQPAPVAAGTEPPLDVAPASTAAGTPSSTGLPRRIGFAASTFGVLALLALLAAVVVLGFSYLAVRETSIASDLSQGDPGRALHALSIAADLNPLSADPGRLAGTIALTSQRYATARQRFEQAISRDPDGWYAWFGAGLAASALGSRAQARRDFQAAASMNPREPTIRRALADLDSRHPLPPATALQLLSSV